MTGGLHAPGKGAKQLEFAALRSRLPHPARGRRRRPATRPERQHVPDPGMYNQASLSMIRFLASSSNPPRRSAALAVAALALAAALGMAPPDARAQYTGNPDNDLTSEQGVEMSRINNGASS